MKKLLFAFMAMALFACSGDDSTPSNPDNENPENPESPNPENPNPVGCTNVFTGNAWLKSQAEVDAFTVKNYCKVEGYLYIGTDYEDVASDITDISALESIESVSKSIMIVNNTGLESLNGLQNIKNGTEFIVQNNGLDNLIGSPDFTQGAKITISTTHPLSLEGFEVKNFMYLTLNGGIDLDYFTAYPNVEVLSQLFLTRISSTTLEGLENVKKIGYLNVTSNLNLVSLKGLENLIRVENIRISMNKELLTLEHLSGITTIGTIDEINSSFFGLDISGNHKLTSLNGLQNVTYYEGFNISFMGNTELSDFCAITTCLQNSDVTQLMIFSNKFNPTRQNILAGNCSQ